MKAHKVPATYYSSWNIKDTKHSFYVFYKSHPNEKGVEKAIAKLIRLHKNMHILWRRIFWKLLCVLEMKV